MVLLIILKFLVAHELKHVDRYKNLNDDEKERSTKISKNPFSSIEQDADAFGSEMVLDGSELVNLIIEGLNYLRRNGKLPYGQNEFRDKVSIAYRLL